MTRSKPLLAALLLLALPLAGCMAEEAPAAEEADVVAASAEEAGARVGPAPAAPKDAFVVASDEGAGEAATAHPVAIATNPAREPVTLDLSGSFGPSDCRPIRFGGQEATLAAASRPFVVHDLSEQLRVGDVFEYEIALSYVNAPSNWAEIHMAYGLGSTIRADDEPTQDKTEVNISFAGQGFRGSEDDMAWLFIECEYAAMTQPIPYTLTVRLQFAEGAVPAEAPVLVPVPAGATRMFVTGVAVDPDAGVMSHFRVFRPDDTLLCECALSSADDVAVVELPEPGDYVILVDHTDNGFVSVALDAPPEAEARPLSAEWIVTPVFAADGQPVDETVEVMLERVPLVMFAQVRPKDGAGLGKHTTLTLTNARGEPLRTSWGGHVTWQDPVMGGMAWLGFWPGDWEFAQDHHAYAQGLHTAHVTSEQLRGEVVLVTRQYVR